MGELSVVRHRLLLAGLLVAQRWHEPGPPPLGARDSRWSFGAQPVEKAVGRLGDAYRRTREAGALTLAPASGMLTTGRGVRVRNHDFYGATRRP
jgi:hypothetical protein